jgi:DNA-binding beta-propeller fold protein YncE
MRVLALLGALVVACTSQPAQSASSSVASASPSGCRLAVIQGSPGQGSGPQTPGFLTIPGGRFAAATNAGSGMYYNARLKRWVSWQPWGMSPDGLRYAYIDTPDTTTSSAHMVDLRTGSDVVLASGGPWRGVGLDADWLYVMRVEYVNTNAYGLLPFGKGLWKLPLKGGAAVQLTSDARSWDGVARGGVYGSQFTTDDAGGPNDIVRFDTSTLKTTVWLDKQARSRLLAVDVDGVALVMTEAATNTLWRVARPGDAVSLGAWASDAIRPEAPVAVDGSDVWFSSLSLTPAWAIFHFSPREGLQQVATFTDRPVTIAGPCA